MMRSFLIALYINGVFIITFFLSKYIQGYQTIGLVFLIALVSVTKFAKVRLRVSDLIAISPFFLFGITALISLSWTQSPIYGLFKVQGYFLSVIGVIVSVYMLDNTGKFNYKEILDFIIINSIIAVVLLAFDNNGLFFGSRITIHGTNSIWLGRYLSIGALVLVSRLRFSKYGLKQKFFSLLILGIIVMAIFMNGSRGPLLALIGTVIFVESLAFFKTRITLQTAFKYYVFSAFALVSVVLLINLFSRLTFDYLSEDLNTLERLQYLDISIKNMKSSGFFGSGMGSFSYILDRFDYRIYPHNIFFEILIELGFVGVSLFIWMLLISFKSPSFDKETYVAWYSISLFLLLTAMISGDLFGNASLFTVLYILSLLKNKVHNEVGVVYCG